MSGRAGRRGIDERGIVMLMVDERMDSTIGKNLLKVRSPTNTGGDAYAFTYSYMYM